MMDEFCDPTGAGWIISPEFYQTHAPAIMDEICEATTPTGYHSSDMVTVDNGTDEPGTVLCGYHELRRLMRQGAAERAQRVRPESPILEGMTRNDVPLSRHVTAGSAGSGGPGGWW